MLRKILLVLSAFVLLAGILAGVAWWRLNDESWVERRLEAAVRESTGRELEVAGRLSLDLGRTTRLEVNDLSLSNAGWAGDEAMLRAERLVLALDLPALLDGRLEVVEFEVSGCRLRLAENAAGERNWNLLREPAADTDDGDGWVIAVRRLRISDCGLSHDAPSRAEPVMLELANATVELTAELHYRGNADGSLDGQTFRLEGSAGPVDALVRGGRFEHDLSLQAGDITLTSEGSVAQLSRLADPDLSLRFRGPEFRDVTRYLTLPPVSEGAFDFDARLTTAGGSTTIDVAGDLGSLELQASGAVDRLLRPDNGELTLQFHGPDLGAVARAVGIEGVSPQPFRLEARARFEDGRTELAPMSLHTDLDQLDIEGRIGAWPGLEDSALKLKLWSSDLGRWGPALMREPAGLPNLSLEADIGIDAKRMLNLQLDARQGDSELAFDGSLGSVGGPWRPRGELRFDSPDAFDVARFLGYAARKPLPVKVSSRFGWTDQGLEVAALDAEIAGNTLQAEGLLTPGAGFRGSRLEGRIAVPDTATLGRRLGVADLPSRPLEIGFRAQPEGEGLAFGITHGQLGEWRISAEGRIETLEPLGGVSARVDLRVPSARLLGDMLPAALPLPDLPLRLSGRVGGEGRVIDVDDASLSLGDDVFRGTATIDLRNGFSGSRMEFAGDGRDWAVLAPRPEWLGLPDTYHVEVRYRREPDAHVVERLDLALGAFTLGLEGEVREVADGIESELMVQAAGPDAAALHPALQELFAGGSFEAGARLRGAAADFRLDDLSLAVGGSRVNGDLRVRRGERVRISGAIDAPLIDLGPALERPESAAQDQGTGRVFEDVPISGYLPVGTDLDVDVSIEKIDLGNSMLQDFAAEVSLEDSLLRLDPLEVRGPQGAAATGRLELDARPDRHRVEGAVAGKGLRFNLMAAEGQPVESYPPIDVDLGFSGSGETLRAVAASLDGSLRFYQGEGRIANTRVTLLFSDFLSELFRLVNPFSDGSEYTELECSVIAAEAADGKIEVAPVVVQTRELTVLAEGVIDLDTETIDVQFNTRPRGGIGVSAGNLVNSFVKVGGTLSDPAVELDPAKAVISGGAAVATAGLSLLAKPLLDRFLGGADPCEAARRQLAERDAAD